MDKQRTIKKKVSFEGVGLHTGEKTKIVLCPAPVNTGIIFVRQDIPTFLVKADLSSLADPEKFPRRTSVGNDGVYIHTIEHLMAALHLLGIDNIQINMWGEEVPGLDGSAKEFIEKIKEAGLLEQGAYRDYLTIKEPLWVDESCASIIVLPSTDLRISYVLKYDNPLIGSGYMDLVINGKATDNFYEARTFCLEDEVKPLLNMGLGKGANYDNTLVVSSKGIIKNKLRFDDEFVKHKILDLVGDLYLVGALKAHVIAVKSGHSLSIKLLDKLRRYKDKVKRGGVGSREGYVPQGTELNAEEIMKILPHRYPFLLVDKVVELEKAKRCVGIKNVSMNEYFFQGHFPGRPVMPGVLIVEAMAQVGGILMLACAEHRGKLAYFMAANNIKFRKTVEPGDQLVIEVNIGKTRSKTGSVYAKASVEGKVVAEAELMFALVE
ncbi:MAG: UDP-3-O-[3-hydroxymyristoyl] N-acetylglucosamine deacetylase [Candidatus Omnitrophota bacterium]|nr:MAG: UDP-3-O-[3-hydroxymyristoyl] N-acetylglucosamine deacetylase [Candidatus Omnitrophota bacterium]